MGEIILNGIGYSNTDTGVLMLNGVNYTGGHSGGGGGGSQFDLIVDHGLICSRAASRFETVTFDDISGYSDVLVRAYATIDSTEYESLFRFKTANIGDELNFRGYLLATTSQDRLFDVTYKLTKTSFAAVDYWGAWYDIYCDVCVSNDGVFQIK